MHPTLASKRTLVAAILLASCATVHAAPAGWEAVDAATLGQQRGGFTTASGLALSFGIERMVSVNGVLLSRTSVSFADLGSIAAQRAGETGATLSALNLLQNGSGNMMAAAFSHDALGATVIQNSLDNQTIDSRTVISASVNSAVLLSAVHFHGNLSEALARAAGP